MAKLAQHLRLDLPHSLASNGKGAADFLESVLGASSRPKRILMIFSSGSERPEHRRYFLYLGRLPLAAFSSAAACFRQVV